MRRVAAVALLWLGLSARPAASFCGFYVASGNARLFNHASQVVLVRDGDRTVITMTSDYRGDPKDFAVVVPVPTVIVKEQVHVGDKGIVDHLDAYSAPRLVEYWDPDPCPQAAVRWRGGPSTNAKSMEQIVVSALRSMPSAVKVESKFTVDEYDIVVLSATESDALERWLHHNH